ncbi:MAG: hypothetical protein WB777_23370 [Mycobacterium sp.]
MMIVIAHPINHTERLFTCSPMTRLLLPTSMIIAIKNGAMAELGAGPNIRCDA